MLQCSSILSTISREVARLPVLHRRTTLVTVLLLAPFAFLGGMVVDRGVLAARDSGTYKQLDLFARVLADIENNYVDEVSETKLIQGAIRGMVETLDPHTVFFSAEVFKNAQIDNRGELGGLGIELTTRVQVSNSARRELLTVVAPIDGTPAARAGVRSGDIVLKIDGEPTAEMDLATALARMRGPAGTKVVLSILRDGFSGPRDLVIVRDYVRIIPVEGKLYSGFAHVKIKNFQEQTDRFLKRTLDDLRRENKGELKGLVLDLRNNPGGLLEEGARVADRFLPGGLTLVTTKGRGNRHVEEEKSHDRDTEPPYPMIVLVNGGSASASEIVAGALQDHGRAVIMGTRTFGKGSVQTLIELEDGSALKLTVARNFTPKGYSIQEKGITPDVVVSDPSEREASPREADLEDHFQSNKYDKKASAPRGKEVSAQLKENLPSQARPEKAEDYLLATALDYLRTSPIFKANPPARVQPARDPN
jgi:carboxyl-terminal processing protease